MPGSSELSVVVLSWNTRDLTLACLRSVCATAAASEIIVVDNASEDGSGAAVAQTFPDVTLVQSQRNLAYAAGNNLGADNATRPYVCFLNSDTEVQPRALERLVAFLDTHPTHAAAAPGLRNRDGSRQAACMRFPRRRTALCFDTVWGRLPGGRAVVDRYFMRDFDHATSRDVEQPPGACFAMRTEEFRAIGGFDTRLPLFFNDVDLCLRLRQRGRRIRYLAAAEVLHHGGASTSRLTDFAVRWHTDRARYYRKHYGRFGLGVALLASHWRALEEWWRIGRHESDTHIRAAARTALRSDLQRIREHGCR